MKLKSFRVLIIGGGIAGPASALFLRKAGISCTVFEANAIGQVGGGLGLAPNGMNVLKTLGLAKIVEEKGTIITRCEFRNQYAKKLAAYNIADPAIYGSPMVTLARATLFACLTDEMKKQDIDVQYDKKLTSIEEREDKVIAHFADGTSAEGDILIGADGVRSAVRRHLFPSGHEATYSGLVGVGGLVPLSSMEQSISINTMTFVFGQNGFFGYVGGDKETVMWWSNIFREKEYIREELQNIDADKIKEEMLERFRDYSGPINPLIKNTTRLLRVNVYDILSLPSWHRNRILLIGDAAHTVSPNVGQGAALALEDAIWIAKLLRDKQCDYQSAFADFERERKSRAEKAVIEGRRRGKDKAVVSPVEQKIRELMIRIFVGLFGKNLDKWLFEYKTDWN